MRLVARNSLREIPQMGRIRVWHAACDTASGGGHDVRATTLRSTIRVICRRTASEVARATSKPECARARVVQTQERGERSGARHLVARALLRSGLRARKQPTWLAATDLVQRVHYALSQVHSRAARAQRAGRRSLRLDPAGSTAGGSAIADAARLARLGRVADAIFGGRALGRSGRAQLQGRGGAAVGASRHGDEPAVSRSPATGRSFGRAACPGGLVPEIRVWAPLWEPSRGCEPGGRFQIVLRPSR